MIYDEILMKIELIKRIHKKDIKNKYKNITTDLSLKELKCIYIRLNNEKN